VVEITQIVQALSKLRFTINVEKILQHEMHDALKKIVDPALIQREYHLDKNSIPDFFIDNRIAIEVKIKGASKRSIYKQCERYCEFEQVKQLILATSLTMGFPEEINGKDCYFINLNRAWL
jgi:hypothetical protein